MADLPTGTPPPPPLAYVGLRRGYGIAWKDFLRPAMPWAFLAGMLAVVLPPVGLFIVLPAALVSSIRRYKREHPLPLRRGQGATMGALTALLSFGTFLFFSLAAIYFKPTEYRDFMLARIHEAAANNPDPQAQTSLQWLATPDGLIFFTVLALGLLFILFLVVGMGTGALSVAMDKPQKRA
ncbi:MAG TPA: hypothetical protein VIJ01_05300 [Candidatus Angelobacter sp.]